MLVHICCFPDSHSKQTTIPCSINFIATSLTLLVLLLTGDTPAKTTPLISLESQGQFGSKVYAYHCQRVRIILIRP
jgi:hypothetical protein